jgi:hypothetical protein
MYNRRALWHHAHVNPRPTSGGTVPQAVDRGGLARGFAGDVTMASFQERRLTIRIATNGQLNVQSENPGPSLRLMDVGPGGFGAHAEGMVPLGTVADYRFTTPDRTWSAVFRARTVYCRAETRDGRPTGTFVTGFTFVSEQPPGIQQQVMAMIDLVTGLVSFS